MSYSEVMQRLEIACRKVGRLPEGVRLVVVSKNQDPETILRIYEQGHRDFGENRAQELVGKAAVLPEDIRWHFVGHLQTNKVRLVRPVASLLHSLDRMELGISWVKGPGSPPPTLIQVNIGREPQKGGVMPEHARNLAEGLTSIGVPVRGLMTIPPQVASPEGSREHFVALRAIWEDLQQAGHRMDVLSMGMSDDFEVAIQEGATDIRIGRAIFRV